MKSQFSVPRWLLNQWAVFILFLSLTSSSDNNFDSSCCLAVHPLEPCLDFDSNSTRGFRTERHKLSNELLFISLPLETYNKQLGSRKPETQKGYQRHKSCTFVMHLHAFFYPSAVFGVVVTSSTHIKRSVRVVLFLFTFSFLLCKEVNHRLR